MVFWRFEPKFIKIGYDSSWDSCKSLKKDKKYEELFAFKQKLNDNWSQSPRAFEWEFDDQQQNKKEG